MLNLFEVLGVTSIILIIILLICLPILLTIIVGIGFANLFGFTGLLWWSFIILFYIIITGILGIICK